METKPNENDGSGARIGRHARWPGQIPPSGWKDVLLRVWRRITDNHLDLVSAGVAFYGLLALFPAIAAMVAVYGLVSDPAQVSAQLSSLRSVLPPDAYQLLDAQLRDLVSANSGKALGAGLAGAILLSVWVATRGTKSMIIALNIVYDEDEKRGFLHLNAVAFAITLFLIILSVVVIGLIVVLPVVMTFIGLGGMADTLVLALRWPVLAALGVATLAVLYRYAPSRHEARWRWVSWGSGLAIAVWLGASGLFSFYVSHFGSYNATYGSLGAVVVLLLWLYLSAYVAILGAQVNAEMERQTECDTTIHGNKPRGSRGAYVADHLPDDGKTASSANG